MGRGSPVAILPHSLRGGPIKQSTHLGRHEIFIRLKSYSYIPLTDMYNTYRSLQGTFCLCSSHSSPLRHSYVVPPECGRCKFVSLAGWMYSSSLAAVSTLSDPFFRLALAIDLGKHAKQGRGDSSHLYSIRTYIHVHVHTNIHTTPS